MPGTVKGKAKVWVLGENGTVVQAGSVVLVRAIEGYKVEFEDVPKRLVRKLWERGIRNPWPGKSERIFPCQEGLFLNALRVRGEKLREQVGESEES